MVAQIPLHNTWNTRGNFKVHIYWRFPRFFRRQDSSRQTS